MICNDMRRYGVYKLDSETGKPRVVNGTGCIQGCYGCEKTCFVGAIITLETMEHEAGSSGNFRPASRYDRCFRQLNKYFTIQEMPVVS